MNSLFAKLTLADVHQEVARNIVSLREPQDLYDDLTGDPAEWRAVTAIRQGAKVQSLQPGMGLKAKRQAAAEFLNDLANHRYNGILHVVREAFPLQSCCGCCRMNKSRHLILKGARLQVSWNF